VKAVFAIVFVILLCGCGNEQHAVVKAKVAAPAKRSQTDRTCDAAGVPNIRTCVNKGIPSRPTIERWTGSRWRVVTGPLDPPEPSAAWAEVSLSPDGRTLLAAWVYPCDSAAVVFVPARGGAPRLVTGEKDWRDAPVAHPLGWTQDGRARVRLYRSWRKYRITPMHPRTFLFDPDAPARDARPVPATGC
jgi:hypothetical protein